MKEELVESDGIFTLGPTMYVIITVAVVAVVVASVGIAICVITRKRRGYSIFSRPSTV